MSAAQHTAGPWKVDGDDIIERTGNLRGVYIAQDSEGGGRIGQTFANCLVTTDEECRANAALWAAAPELLAACKLWMAYQLAIESDDPKVSRPFNAYSEAMDATFAAIAKASGSAT